MASLLEDMPEDWPRYRRKPNEENMITRMAYTLRGFDMHLIQKRALDVANLWRPRNCHMDTAVQGKGCPRLPT